ncbi:hypothetical protein A0130_02740 [Leifsonia xyli]|nr:hypothetical protein A0130_02740 [Leifsonia xyli]
MALGRFEYAQRIANVQERYDSYLRTAVEAEASLLKYYSPAEVDRLVLGPTFQQFSDSNLAAFGWTHQRLDNELERRVETLTNEITDLQEEIARWAYQVPEGAFADHRLHALVIDTGVLEEHPDRAELADLAPKWLEQARRPSGGIALAFASVTLDEIDRHKTVAQKMHGGDKLLKTEARRAQKLLGSLFDGGVQRSEIDSSWHGIYGFLQARPLGHVPFAIADNEIISYALDLVPFAASVTFVTYDLGPSITAEQQNLRALRLDYAD